MKVSNARSSIKLMRKMPVLCCCFFFLQKTNLKAVYTKNNKLYICYIMIQKRKHEYFLTIIKILLGFDLKALKLSSK